MHEQSSCATDAPESEQNQQAAETRRLLPEMLGTELPMDAAAPSSGERTGSGAQSAGDVDAAETSHDELDASNHAFLPTAPDAVDDSGLPQSQIETLILKFLMCRGVKCGRQIARQLKLPLRVVDIVLRQLKTDQFVVYKRSNGLTDFDYELTDRGMHEARRYIVQSTYFGAAPVPFDRYVESVTAQSVGLERVKSTDLQAALSDLLIDPDLHGRLGQAMTAGRAMFLYGEPGNGKTSIAERLTSAFGSAIWIPRAIYLDGEIMRLYDPLVHEQLEVRVGKETEIDERWVCVRRPTVVVGGELTLEHFEVTANSTAGILEAPVQLKSNCGTLVVDDFGRQRVNPSDLLNRWIVPLEKRFDYLSLPSGKKIQVPCDQLMVFSTNLDPKQIVDEAFLRRIPYKIEVGDPTEDIFRSLFPIIAARLGVEHDDSVVENLIEKHYRASGRPFRYCHVRDLLLQISHYCTFNEVPARMTEELVDEAVANYFAAVL